MMQNQNDNEEFLDPEIKANASSAINSDTLDKEPKKAIVKTVAPRRSVPKLIQEVIDHGIPVLLNREGYLIPGFYGSTHSGQVGVVYAQDTEKSSEMLFFDHKNRKHVISSFKELVELNNTVWGSFYREKEYSTPNQMWFPHLMNFGVLNISPGR